MENEISAGLKNAMERGESLEHAMQTFVNAGYNPQEVKAAGASLSQGVSDIVYTPGGREENDAEERNQAPEKKGKSKKTILIIVLILAAVIFLGTLGYLIFKFAV